MNIGKTPLSKVYHIATSISLLTYLLTGVTLALCFAVGFYFDIELYVFLAMLAIPLLWIMLHYPRVWIYVVVLGFSVFMGKTETEVSVVDIFVAVIYNGFLIIWFLVKIAVKTEFLVNVSNNASTRKFFPINNLSDKLFFLFYFFLIFNAVIAVLNGIELGEWLREYMLYSMILFYFPMREYFEDISAIKVLIFFFAVAVISLDLRQFYFYYKMLGEIKYAYQIGGSVRINQQIFSASVISAIVFFFYCKTKKGKLLAFVVAMLSISAIITTFSRAFWMSIIGMLCILLLFLNRKQILQFLLVIILSAGIVFISINLFFPKQSAMLTKYIEKRFISTGNVKSDVSVKSRLYEYNEVIKEIDESPIAGHGFRKKYTFYNNLSRNSNTKSFTHNGYLNLAHKAGILMDCLFYLAVLIVMIQGFINSWRLKTYCNKISPDSPHLSSYKLYTAIAISASLTLGMLFITNFVTSSFIFRDGLMVTAFSIAFIHISGKKLQATNIE